MGGLISAGYNRTYFTGAQTQVVLDDTPIEEAVEIEGMYDVSQYPIYGYKSSHFDTVASGRVIAQGSLTINYVFDGYLYTLIKKSQQKQADKQTAIDNAGSTSLNSLIPTLMPNMNEVESTLYSPAAQEAMKQQFWGDYGYLKNINHKVIRPEFIGPVTLKIHDFRIGYPRFDNVGDVNAQSNFEERIFFNVFFNKYSTIRNKSAAPVAEVYSFIAQSFI